MKDYLCAGLCESAKPVKTMKLIFLTSFLILSQTLRLVAQKKKENDTTSKELKAVVIFASPYEASKQMPVSYSQVDSSSIRLLDYGAEPAFMLQRFPEITFTTDNGTNYGYSYFRFRGLDQSHINITVNGMPLNEPEDAGAYFSNFAGLLSNSSSVQLQRGLGLSKNGAPAFAGSLDFETKQSLNNSGSHPGYSELGLQAGSFSSGRLYAERQRGNERNLFFYKMNVLTTDGYKYHSGNNSESGFFQWQHQSENTSIQYMILGGKNENGLGWLGVSDSAAHADFKNNGNTIKEKGNFFQLLQQLHITTKLGKNQVLHAGIFYNYSNGNYWFDLYNFLQLPFQGQMLDYRTRSNFSGVTLDYQFTGKNYSFTTGVYGSLYRKFHDGVQDSGSVLLYHNHGDKNEISPFAKFIFRKNRFYFFSDLQYRFASFVYTGDVALKNFDWNFFNPLAGAGYRLNKNFYLYANAGNIKREPGRNDIFLGNDNLQKDSAGNAVYANLMPENNFSMETGLRFEEKRLQGSVNIYRMQIKNAIDLNGQIGPTGLPLHSNVAKAIREGVEMELIYHFSKSWQLMQSFSVAPHYILEESKPSDPVLTPKLILFTEIQFMQNNWAFVLQGRYQSRSYIDFSNHYYLPSSAIFNFLIKYSFKKMFFTLRLLNFTDQKVFSSGQLNVYGKQIYQVQAPFNFLSGLGIKL